MRECEYGAEYEQCGKEEYSCEVQTFCKGAERGR